MNRLLLILLAGILASLLFGCASPVSTPAPLPTPTATTTAAKSGKIRYAAITAPNVSSMSWLLALDELKRQGYDVEMITLASPDLVTAALARGDADVGGSGPPSGWVAITKGAPLRAIVAQNQNPFLIASKAEIKNCQDLDKKPFGLGSPGTTNTFLASQYLQQNCPTAAPQFVTLADSQARASALQAGDVDATILEISDLQHLDSSAPGKFHALTVFGKTYPKILYSLTAVNLNFAAKHPDIAQAYVRAVVTVNRKMYSDPSFLQAAIVQHLQFTPAQAKVAADAYLGAGLWDANGGLSTQALQETLDFYKQQNKLPATLKPEDVADLSYLNAVLIELGRQ